MNITDIARAIRAEITAAEAALAKADALATAEFRALIEPADLAKVEAAHARAVKAVNALHRAAAKAKPRGDVILPQFGK
jgi:hypothetical protein